MLSGECALTLARGFLPKIATTSYRRWSLRSGARSLRVVGSRRKLRWLPPIAAVASRPVRTQAIIKRRFSSDGFPVRPDKVVWPAVLAHGKYHLIKS